MAITIKNKLDKYKRTIYVILDDLPYEIKHNGTIDLEAGKSALIILDHKPRIYPKQFVLTYDMNLDSGNLVEFKKPYPTFPGPDEDTIGTKKEIRIQGGKVPNWSIRVTNPKPKESDQVGKPVSGNVIVGDDDQNGKVNG